MRENSFSLLALGCAALAACRPDDEPTDGTDEPVPSEEVLKVGTWWTASSELESLGAIISAFRSGGDESDVELVLVEHDAEKRRETYHTIEWDIGQEVSCCLETSIGDLALDLHDVPELGDTLETIRSEFLVLGEQGELLGFPTNVHRENTLHYRLDSVSSPPSTPLGLREQCDAYATSDRTGPAPLAIAEPTVENSWIHRVLFAAMLPPSVMSGEEPDPRPAVLDALETIERFVEKDCFFYAATWDQATQALIDGDASMFIHGDWARGYLLRNGLVAGLDFEVTGTPGAEGAYYYNVDAFALNGESERKDMAIRFLETALSPEVQIAFSELKGSIPAVRIDDPETQIEDPSLRETYFELEAAHSAGTALIQTPWVTDNSELLLPLMTGEETAEEVADRFLALYPRGP